jgi:hypothetical protein
LTSRRFRGLLLLAPARRPDSRTARPSRLAKGAHAPSIPTPRPSPSRGGRARRTDDGDHGTAPARRRLASPVTRGWCAARRRTAPPRRQPTPAGIPRPAGPLPPPPRQRAPPCRVELDLLSSSVLLKQTPRRVVVAGEAGASFCVGAAVVGSSSRVVPAHERPHGTSRQRSSSAHAPSLQRYEQYVRRARVLRSDQIQNRRIPGTAARSPAGRGGIRRRSPRLVCPSWPLPSGHVRRPAAPRSPSAIGIHPAINGRHGAAMAPPMRACRRSMTRAGDALMDHHGVCVWSSGDMVRRRMIFFPPSTAP